MDDDRSRKGVRVRRRGWPGALQVTVLVATVMLLWTAWVVGKVQVPDGARSASPQVIKLDRADDCPRDYHAPADPVF
jgi:hypothetical protein